MKSQIIKITINVLMCAAISIATFMLMRKHFMPELPPAPTDVITKKELQINQSITDSTIQSIKLNVDSLLYQTQTNEATIQRIHNSRTGANSSISAMSSHELTSTLTSRYIDSL